jgi:hypothetical protein
MFFRRIFFSAATLLMISAIVLSNAAAQPSDPIPEEISDTAFWKLITSMSEPDGQFRYENFLSNELQYQYVIPELKATTHPGGAYLGVGPEQNFTYIAALQPKIAFITDIRRQNMLELMMYKAIFELAPDRADFLSLLFSRKRPGGIKAGSTVDQLLREFAGAERDSALQQFNLKAIQDQLVQKHQFGLTTADLQNIGYLHGVFYKDGPSMDYSSGNLGTAPGSGMPSYTELMVADDAHGTHRSFLANDENYQFIREMELRNRIVPLVGDFAGPKTIRAIGQYLKDHDAPVAAFYVSNVEQYLYSDGKLLDFFKNVATLPMNESSTFIQTFGPNGAGISFSGGNGFQSMISSMMDVVKVCAAGRGCDYSVVREMSK